MIQVIMPMAGEASRFKGAGYKQYKPFIMLEGKPLFQWAYESLMIEEFRVFPVIQRLCFDSKFLSSFECTLLDRRTAGALETAMCAIDRVDLASPLVVLDCDLAFKSATFTQMLQEKNPFDAALLTFKSTDPRFSYVDIGEDGLAREIKEKKVISHYAVIGAYYFSSGLIFKECAQKVLALGLERLECKEFYLSCAYEQLLQEKKSIRVYDSEQFFSFGTPEELAASSKRIASGALI